MSTPQTSSHVAPRFRIGLGTMLTALGVLIAIAVTITILALTGANHTTVATPGPWGGPMSSGPTSARGAAPTIGATPHTRYLGPRQERAAINPQSGGRTTSATGAGNLAPH